MRDSVKDSMQVRHMCWVSIPYPLPPTPYSSSGEPLLITGLISIRRSDIPWNVSETFRGIDRLGHSLEEMANGI